MDVELDSMSNAVRIGTPGITTRETRESTGSPIRAHGPEMRRCVRGAEETVKPVLTGPAAPL